MLWAALPVLAGVNARREWTAWSSYVNEPNDGHEVEGDTAVNRGR